MDNEYIVTKNIDYILELKEKKYKYTHIAKLLNISVHMLKYYLKKLGKFEKSTSYYRQKGQRLLDRKSEIINLFNQGLKLKEIGQQTGFCVSKIGKLLRDDGYTRHYSFNFRFFKTIDTQEKAYFLGLLFADGWVNINNNRCGLEMTDKDILYKIKDCIGYTGPIRERKRHENWKKTYSITLHNSYIINDLISLGCIPNKSHILEFPEIDNDLVRHFIRGFCDGDACFSTKRSLVSVNSTFNFLAVLDNVVNFNLDFSGRINLHSRTNKYIYKWILYKKSLAIQFLDWLYKDSTIHMDRKYNTYLKLKETT